MPVLRLLIIILILLVLGLLSLNPNASIAQDSPISPIVTLRPLSTLTPTATPTFVILPLPTIVPSATPTVTPTLTLTSTPVIKFASFRDYCENGRYYFEFISIGSYKIKIESYVNSKLFETRYITTYGLERIYTFTHVQWSMMYKLYYPIDSEFPLYVTVHNTCSLNTYIIYFSEVRN